MTTTLDAIFNATSELTECGHDLASISRALHIVGLEKLADDIASIGASISNNAKAVRDAYSKDVCEAVRRADQYTANMVNASTSAASMQIQSQQQL